MSTGRVVNLDLYSDFISFIRSELTRLGYVSVYSQEDEDILRIYLDVCKRLVAPQPRTVHREKGFSCPARFLRSMAQIEQLVKNGDDITPYLSKRIKRLIYRDSMLNDWGIHHLHLGDKTRHDGFIGRTGPLLYCRFEQQDAYFLDILPHGHWTTQTLVTTMHENWPSMLHRYQLHGVRGARISDLEIKELRRKNCNYCLEMADGTVYAPPGGGVVGSGSNVMSVWTEMQIRNLLQQEQDLVRTSIDEIAASALEEGVTLPNPANFDLHILNAQFYAVERDSRVAVCLKAFSQTAIGNDQHRN
ncbi:MAG: hypothetical protein OXP75_01515 [Rhodospirillales bacterium]|nr:hypothetical protein [Rhodospirillales bacterium]